MTTRDFCRELQTYEHRLFIFSLKLTKNQHDAKDLFQESVARAFQYSHRFTVGTNFRAWMAKIIYNTFINIYKVKKKNKIVKEPIEHFMEVYENQIIISNQGEANMRIEELNRLLNQLGNLYRIPFLMHIQGYEYQEIAAHLNLPMGTVKSRLHNARKLLKEMILNEK